MTDAPYRTAVAGSARHVAEPARREINGCASGR